MILSGLEILSKVGLQAITIDPFHPQNLNPNSYNYGLAPTLRVSKAFSLDAHSPVEWEDQTIPPDGLTLLPHRLYLGATVEKIGSASYVTTLIGRSSLGRLGMFLTTSADLGNLGPAHCWTLEITVVQPLVVYPLMRIGQVSFWKPRGALRNYSSPYVQHNGPAPAIFTRIAGEDAFLYDSDGE